MPFQTEPFIADGKQVHYGRIKLKDNYYQRVEPHLPEEARLLLYRVDLHDLVVRRMEGPTKKTYELQVDFIHLHFSGVTAVKQRGVVLQDCVYDFVLAATDTGGFEMGIALHDSEFYICAQSVTCAYEAEGRFTWRIGGPPAEVQETKKKEIAAGMTRRQKKKLREDQ